MTISARQIGHDSRVGPGGVSTFVTASYTPNANERLMLAVETSDNFAVTSCTGMGLTWTQVDSQAHNPSNNLVLLTAVAGGSPSSGAITLNFAGNIIEIITSLSGFLNVIGLGTPVKTAHQANPAVTLAALNSTDSLAYSCIGFGSAVLPVQGSGFTLLDAYRPDEGIGAEYRQNVTSVTWSGPTNTNNGLIGVELQAAPAASTKVTQEYAEVLESNVATSRVTQEYAEVLESAETPHSRVTQEYVEVLESVADVESRVTQEYVEVLESAEAAEFSVPTYRRYGYLGCGTWTVRIARRGGSPVEVEAPASSVEMTRAEDDLSTATATFAYSQVPDWCLGALADLRPWVYELSLLRDDVEVWVGPISDRITFTGTGMTVNARDLFSWMERRNLPFDESFHEDLSDIFAQLVADALFRDPSPNITVDAEPSGIVGNRAYLASEHKRAADALRDIGNLGVDFTMVGRTLRVRGREMGDVLANTLLPHHFKAGATATIDGLNAASEWVVLGATPAVARSAGGVGAQMGLVTQTYSDSDITDPSDAHDAAAELLAASGAAPLQVQGSLSPEAPFTFEELIPGNLVPVRVGFGPLFISEQMMLTSVGVSTDDEEDVKVTLLRSSPSVPSGSIG